MPAPEMPVDAARIPVPRGDGSGPALETAPDAVCETGPEAVMAAVMEVAAAVRRSGPAVHVVCAPVSMPIVADGLLAAGARPMMTETRSEAPAMTAVADALLVNLGGLSTEAAGAIELLVEACRQAGHPWVLDPAAIGVAPVRTPLARRLLDAAPAVVRGNASEVLVLAGTGSGGRGADARHAVSESASAAGRLARQTGGAVSVSGAVDLVVGAGRRYDVVGGSALLPRVVGTGCLLGALTAACCTTTDPVTAAVAASTWLARAGELAQSRSRGPGTFRVQLVDALDEVLR